MAAVSLLFTQAPAGAGKVTLVFGSDGVDKSVRLRANLPGPTVAARVAPPGKVRIAATLPKPVLIGEIAAPDHITVAITLPLPALAAEIDSPNGLHLSTTLPLPALVAKLAAPRPVRIVATLALPTVSAQAVFSSLTDRPTVGQTTTSHQTAPDLRAGAEQRSQSPIRTFSGAPSPWRRAQASPAGVESRKARTLLPTFVATVAEHAGAQPKRAGRGDVFSNMLRDRRFASTTGFQRGQGVRTSAWSNWQERFRDRRPGAAARFQGAAQSGLSRTDSAGTAQRKSAGSGTRFQEAMRPSIGVWVPAVPPVKERCYTPSTALVFKDTSAGSNLVFICERHTEPPPPEVSTTIVPVRRVYIVLNDISLRRVVGNIPVPANTLSLSLDVDSWTYGFNASLPAGALQYLQPESDGAPALLEASINGNVFRLLAESVTRDRTFGTGTLTVQGRGQNALLDAPYAPVMQFNNASARTAQQLMADVLTANGVSLGWGVDWGITDWLVPAGVWAAQGSYIGALNDIAGAAGAYLQPHPTSDIIRVLPRYPSGPWAWGSVTPDFELPSDVTLQETIEWSNKVPYDSVVVSGISAGVLAQITRAGTDGGIPAPMVTHALITEAAAARQRGLPVLADTGRQARVSLKTPVLSETGIIMPGKFVRYLDTLAGISRVGIVRGVDVAAGFNDVWQTLAVETHEGA